MYRQSSFGDRSQAVARHETTKSNSEPTGLLRCGGEPCTNRRSVDGSTCLKLCGGICSKAQLKRRLQIGNSLTDQLELKTIYRCVVLRDRSKDFVDDEANVCL